MTRKEEADAVAYFPHEIQIRREAWLRFDLGQLAAELERHGRPEIQFYRELAHRLTANRPPGGEPVQAGMLNLYALQARIFRHIVATFTGSTRPGLWDRVLVQAGYDYHSPPLQRLLERFGAHFPCGEELSGRVTGPAEYLAGDDPSHGRKKGAVAELLLLPVAAENPALDSFRVLVDDSDLDRESGYRSTVAALERLLAADGEVAPGGLSLPDLLRAPLRAAPHSLYEQLRFMQTAWESLLPPDLLVEVASAFAVAEEEGRVFAGHGDVVVDLPVFSRHGGAGLGDYYPEPEQFSADADWMSNVVMLAKMVYVWLDQLSKRYGCEIARLDQIPDAELDRLARWGFTGLWLIGLWERSPASRRIKQIAGNEDAIASAYSLYDYVIAADLGGDGALAELKERCRRRGIRLASDMVPNHTGLYSKWTREHPDWFVQLDYPPYPGYRFNGPDLSFSSEITLQVEDGYWDRTDAAVVFRHHDHRDGRTRYIYHGNDGTSTPWNDTAQLNYLLPEVREAVIRTILHVARQFPIIRFDAAMTLAKKHYQRLWYPQPGHGGVPSRAEHGMTREAFDAAFPVEFWREVVDRVAAEVPDTLLLAEAFWLMEGYFVRTLGMHRVYNSAFMNMLKLEENAKYRQTIKNVLEFNPEILKRFVNFMNNPDEKTAVEQFGKEGKYFGACVLLVTMPGLPMFGHGQIEGLHEKYGMEYRRAYWEEPVDAHLVTAHERLVFPLMRRRWLFSGAENFVLYDFWAGDAVDENVFAYSNGAGSERGLVLYHNRYAETSGWIRTSAAFAGKGASGEAELRRTTLGDALGCRGDGRHYYLFRDHVSGLEYIRNGRELCEQGLYVTLEAYECHVFLDFREVRDDESGTWGELCRQLDGRPVPSLDEEVKQIRFAPLIARLRGLLERHAPRLVLPPEAGQDEDERGTEREDFAGDFTSFLGALAVAAGLDADPAPVAAALLAELDSLWMVPADSDRMPEGRTARLLLSAWLCLHRIGMLAGEEELASHTEDLAGRFGLTRPLEEMLYGEATEDDDPLAVLDVPALMALFNLLLRWQRLLADPPLDTEAVCRALFADQDVAAFVGRHESDGCEWFAKERWELLVKWCATVSLLVMDGEGASGAISEEDRKGLQATAAALVARAEDAGYRVAGMIGGGEEPLRESEPGMLPAE
jgi:glycosidase